MQINELPKPAYMQKSLRDLKIGTYDNIETADETTSIITALKKFVERRVSALPLVDAEGRLVDIYAKFDVIVSSPFKKPRRRKIILFIFAESRR